MIDEALARFGKVDILINNAGRTADNLVIRMSDEEWDQVIETNLRSTFLFARAALRPMLRQRYGRIIMAADSPDQELTAEMIKPVMRDCIVVGGARMTGEAIARACEVGAAAVVSGGLDDEDLREFLGYDLGVAITGSEDVGLSLIITEGFGDITMAQRTFDLLGSREGADASINGATQIRAGVMRPEIIIPLSEKESAEAKPAGQPDSELRLGRPVRIIRDPHFGQIGEVSGLPPEPQALESGSRARVLEVKLDSGDSVTIPRANVELIEG